jgi:tetrahydromethanopterin S-methyltransferase subunit G
MISVAGIFSHRSGPMDTIDKLRSLGIPDERLILLYPGAADEEVEEVMPKVETGDRGTGEKIGNAVGRGIGIAGGIMLGGVVGSVFVPGVGAVLATGVLASALLGTGGAALGATAGSALDEKSAEHLRHDQLHLYEASLRQGRSVLVALANEEREAQAMREILDDAGAETLENARKNWWSELRSAEEAAYKKEGRDFALDETLYQRGFEAAQHPRLRGKSLAESAGLLAQYFGDDQQTEAFQRGYERGQAYNQDLLEKFPAAAKAAPAGRENEGPL